MFAAMARFWEAVRGGYRTNREIIAWLEQFSPNSAGALVARADSTLVSARDTLPLLCRLMEQICDNPIELQPIETACTSDSAKTAAQDLAQHFMVHGSDKATDHDYHFLYGEILAPLRNARAAILEIGLGTNYTDVLSHMGKRGTPGASLRAFREFLPAARIFGADVDRRILFNEDRIATYYVDQTDEASFRELEYRLQNESFDLVIDDGLHAPNANLATLAFALRRLKPGGHVVIEDIDTRSLAIWKLVGRILPSPFSASLFAAKGGNVFVVKAGHE
jgi:SAM-dependent methyltransferase